MPWLNSRQGNITLLTLFVSCFLFACSTLPDAGTEPQKSPNDSKAYRLITLENELQVLLISDPKTKKAAAALDVMVGSGDNPADRGGLAHFLEHMLFLGTDKYPDPAEYAEYISEHGGSRNAYTAAEHTNYFFDINAAYLPESLDRFAQFFIAPKFDAKYVEREKNAVQAEYQMGLKNDGRRDQDVLREVVNPDHPFSKFAVGSLDTLEDRPGSTVRDELLAFYDKYYSANQMKLAVLGSESLDELEVLVRPMFSPIPNKSFEHAEIEAPLFVDGDLPMLVKVKPQATMRQLQVAFPIADYRKAYKAKPLSYLGNLVGHEGEGSLLSQLKEQGLAESLGAGSGLAWRGGALFAVSVTLTERGVENYDRVLQLIFAYMDMLRQEGPRRWLYDEQSRLAGLAFRFREESEPLGYVASSVVGMHTYAAEDVLQGPYLMSDYDESMLQDLLVGLVPENALVTLTDKSVDTDLTSNHYQVPYSRRSIGAPQLARWQSEPDTGALSLPKPNEFIADDVSLKPIAGENPATPEVVLTKGRQKVWFVQDEEFRIPKGATYINFRSPAVGQNAQQTAAAILYTALLEDSVNEFAYPALLAGLNFSLYKHAQGISLRISGYDDKQNILLDHLLGAMVDFSFDEQRFTDLRQEMILSLENIVAKRPASQVISDLREALLYGEWGEQALIDALERIDEKGMHAYAESFWRDARAEVMIYGNYDPTRAQEVATMLSRLLSDEVAPPIADLKVLKLAAGEELQFAVDVPHDDSVVAWYLQGQGNTWRDRAATDLTVQLIKSGFFHELRTEQQLGYIVQASGLSQLTVPGLLLLIQSPTTSAAEVAAAMEAFMADVTQDLTEDQFARNKEALLGEILRPDKNLWVRAEFYWQSIAMKQTDFDGREALAEAVRGFSKESWMAYFNEVFMAQRHSLQVVAPGQWDKLPATPNPPIYDAMSIKEGHDVYLIK